MGQLSFISIAQAKKRLRKEKFLNEMDQVIPWKKLAKIVKPCYRDSKIGRNKMPLERMLRILCLQQWYGLSDPAVEEEIYDRASFQKFLNLDLLSDPVPDETTVLRFRHLLEEHGLFQKIFDEIKKHLETKGFLMKAGTIVDATIVAAPSSTKNQSGKRDPEMSSTKKGNDWYFGMKAHIGVDFQSGLVHTVKATTAKAHDSTRFDDLLHGGEKIVFGDKAYHNEKKKRDFGWRNIHWGILKKAGPNEVLTDHQESINRNLSKIRCLVEHPFQVVKCQWNYNKVRYKGISKNFDQQLLLFGLYNIFKVRKLLLTS